jgi:hypothetical protein
MIRSSQWTRRHDCQHFDTHYADADAAAVAFPQGGNGGRKGELDAMEAGERERMGAGARKVRAMGS